MPITIVKAINHEKSDCIKMQGTAKEIQKYLDAGYSVEIERNGYWVLAKPSKINVTLSKGSLTRIFDMRESVLEFYNRQRVNKNLVQRFKDDITSGKIQITLDSDESYSFI